MSQAGRYTPSNFPVGFVETLTGNIGGPVPPTASNINIITQDTTVLFDGFPGISTIILDFGIDNLIMGSLPLVTGTLNVGVGQFALNNLTTGNANVAIGSSAARLGTSASDNIAIGSSALLNNNTGNRNVAIGTSALLNNNALGNTAIGYQVLLNNISGIDNIGIGPLAITSNLSGSENIGIGLAALQNNTNGTSNIAIGTGALAANNGDDNIGIGQHALFDCTTGFNNIAIGINAGFVYTTESNNICIGLAGVVGDSGFTRIAGIFGETVGITNGIVFIDDTGKLGTAGGGSSAVLKLTGNTGGAVPPTAGNINIITANATVKFVGNPGTSTITQDFGLTNLILGSLPLVTGTDNVGVGQTALNALTTGSRNVAVGSGAAPILTAGGDNIAIGNNALALATTTLQNVCIGTQAGSSLTTAIAGAGNTALGYRALQEGTGSSNIAIGFLTTGTAGWSGSNNIMLGVQIGIASTGSGFTGTESNNVIIQNTGDAGDQHIGRIGTFGSGNGEQLLFHIEPPLTVDNGDITIAGASTGGNLNLPLTNTPSFGVLTIGGSSFLHAAGGTNVFLGPVAGNFSVSGGGNVVIGNVAGIAISTGGGNIIIGNGAGTSLNTGLLNTIVGDVAGVSITSGISNTIIGTAAGSSYTTENSNICIKNTGVVADSGAIRIGTKTSQTSCFIQGIDNTALTAGAYVGIDPTNGQLGLLGADAGTITGSGQTINAVTNNIITFGLGIVPATYRIEAKVSGFEATGNSAGYSLFATVRTNGIVAAIVGVQQINNNDAALAAAGATFVITGANNLTLQVLGVAGLTINWDALASFILTT